MASSSNQNVNQVVTSRTELPAWYQQYLQNLIGRTEAYTGEEYQPYGGPRVAGLDPMQTGAAQIAQSLSTAANPYFGAANDLYGQGAQAVNTDFRGAIAPSTGILQDAAARDTASVAQPYAQTGQQYLTDATGNYGLSAASPYLGMAGSSFPQMAGAYMSPYTEGVVNRIGQLAGRNLTENILPAVSDDFIRAGQYGSTRQRDLVGRALRDTQEAALAEQARALESGYGTAGQLYGQDAARYAGLAGTAGGLGTAQQQALLTAGQGIGSLGLGLSSAQAADAQRALQAGQSIGSLGLSAAQGEAAQAEANRQALFQSGQLQQNLGVTGLNSLTNAALLQNQFGQQQQANVQQNYDTAYGDFREQRDYPAQQIGLLSNVVHGLPVNTSGTAQTTGTTSSNPSTLGQVAGLGATALGVYNAFKAKGGRVRKQRPYRHRSAGLGSLRMAA